jgi:hypothetical protein
VDRVYKKDIPALIATLEDLKDEFAGLATRTDWVQLRIEPLLHHSRSLLRILRAPEFSRETSRLTKGVAMFRSDLIYLRENVKALKAILESEKKSISRRPAASASQRVTQAAGRRRGIATA